MGGKGWAVFLARKRHALYNSNREARRNGYLGSTNKFAGRMDSVLDIRCSLRRLMVTGSNVSVVCITTGAKGGV